MKAVSTLLIVLFLGSITLAAPATQPQTATVDIVFCIDCSGSMGGVIETAKQKVWGIVNEIAKVRPTPVLRIGLIGYGNANGPFREFALSSDLDDVYKNLMTFKDEGWGDEYVGLAVQRATDTMVWSDSHQTLKVIYVIGNETARQGPVDYTSSAPAAIAKGIIVNAIYCGTTEYETATPTWREMAKLADGQYLEIAGNGGAVTLQTPFDDDLAKLNTQLNGTYVTYGAAGAMSASNQAIQDANSLRVAGGNNTVVAERAISKASPMYRNGSWDLVDASKAENFDLSKMKDEDLPEAMRGMTLEQRKAYIQTKADERAQLQAKVQELATQRDVYVKQKIAADGLSADQALDAAVKDSITNQARAKGFQIPAQP